MDAEQVERIPRGLNLPVRASMRTSKTAPQACKAEYPVGYPCFGPIIARGTRGIMLRLEEHRMPCSMVSLQGLRALARLATVMATCCSMPPPVIRIVLSSTAVSSGTGCARRLM